MHLTRPKSSKGRSRPPADHTVGDTGHARSDHTPAASSSSTSRSPPAVTSTWPHTRPPGPDDTAAQCGPGARSSPLSLNKYKHRRHSHGTAPAGSGASKARQTATRSDPEIGNVADAYYRFASAPPDPDPDPDPDITETQEETAPVVAAATDGLLLAIRAPCGRRFQQHFASGDSLHTLIACAEARYETSYPEAFVETMDVPRRSFRRLDATLSECRIFNRSVLCISQESHSGEMNHVLNE
ncbi:hypothetical protein CRUP_018751 [Coryphaenoides rupestris]|nr:hypothetical protein CRUP_018751 [Coryphaenoides rupestris]